MIVSAFTDFLASQKMPVLDIPTLYNEIGQGTNDTIAPKLEQMGLRIQQVVVENISLPDEVEKAIDTRASMGALGNMNTYTQYKAANAIETAAANEGNGGFAGMGVGLGAGVGFGQMMGNTMNQAVQANNQQDPKVICPHCGKQVNNGKFCPECGKPLVVNKVKCIKCGAEIAEGAKFCPECGASQVVVDVVCPKCGKKVPGGTKFCPDCGEKLG